LTVKLPDRLRHAWPHAFVVLAVLLVTRDWWNDYLLAGHSAYMDFYRQVVLHDAIRQGDWWPRFAEPFYRGHGSLLFHFYAPFSYYLTELFIFLHAPIAVAIKMALATGLFLSGYFMVRLTRELFDDWAAAAAGALYVLAPYHLVDVLARHAFGEAIAFAWLPLIFWGLLGAVRDGSRLRLAAGTVGIALLLLTHNITAMISAPFIFLWWLYLTIVYGKENRRGPLFGALTGVLGLLLAAFFWMPAVMETNFIWSEKSLTDDYFQYQKHFVYCKQFFSLMWAHGGSGPGMDDTLPYQLGLAHWLLLPGSLIALWRWRDKRGQLLLWWALLLAALAMCHFISRPVWSAIDKLAFVQFPWRFLVLASFAGSLLAGVAASGLRRWNWGGQGVAFALCAVCLPLVVYAPYTYAKHTLYNTENGKYLRLNKDDYAESLPYKKFIRLEKTVDATWISRRLIRATAREDFLPKTVRDIPPRPPETIFSVAGGVVLDQRREAPCRYRAQVVMDDAGDLLLNRFWYPGWRATVDGHDVSTGAFGPHGLIRIMLPAGEHEVSVVFGTTPLRTTAWLISLAALFALIAAMIFFRPGVLSKN